MTIYPPLSRPFRVSQYFGEHPSWYAQYGLAGHHGIDIPGDVGETLHAGVGGWASGRFIRFRSGTAATPVNQAAARTLHLLVRPI